MTTVARRVTMEDKENIIELKPMEPRAIDFFRASDGEVTLRLWATPDEMLLWHDAIVEFIHRGV